MTGRKLKAVRPRIEALVAQDRDLLKTLVKETLEARQAEMTEGKGSARCSALASRESQSSWREFLLALTQCGLAGVEFVVSDDHVGLMKAIAEILPEAALVGVSPRGRVSAT